jgi:hypothetical protein
MIFVASFGKGTNFISTFFVTFKGCLFDFGINVRVSDAEGFSFISGHNVDCTQNERSYIPE